MRGARKDGGEVVRGMRTACGETSGGGKPTKGLVGWKEVCMYV